jgi:membrane-bound lytic murein transglycosylase MltF
MKRCLLLLLLLLPRVAPAQVDPAPAAQFVRQYAGHYRVSPELVAALIDVESRWNPRALSSKGAMGLMQLMPATARRYGAVKPFDVEQNIAAGNLLVKLWTGRQLQPRSLPQNARDSSTTLWAKSIRVASTMARRWNPAGTLSL